MLGVGRAVGCRRKVSWVGFGVVVMVVGLDVMRILLSIDSLLNVF